MLTTVSPTGDLDPATVARFRAQAIYLNTDRSYAGLSELTECEGCEEGIVQRVAVDYDPDFGVSYDAVAGCSLSVERVTATIGGELRTIVDMTWLCPACTAAKQQAA